MLLLPSVSGFDFEKVHTGIKVTQNYFLNHKIIVFKKIQESEENIYVLIEFRNSAIIIVIYIYVCVYM